MELLLGCGSNRDKKLFETGRSEWSALVSLDYNPAHNPDVVADLNDPLPFDDDSADEIHAYEVLEHLGGIGDYKTFFDNFSDYWRVLRGGGKLFATVPAMDSPWLFGDPSHTRVINNEQLTFLHQPAYDQVGKTPMSDFRNIYKADFDIKYAKSNAGNSFVFILEAVKPSRCKV